MYSPFSVISSTQKFLRAKTVFSEAKCGNKLSVISEHLCLEVPLTLENQPLIKRVCKTLILKSGMVYQVSGTL